MSLYGVWGYGEQFFGTWTAQATLGLRCYRRIPTGIECHGSLCGTYGPRDAALYKHATSHGRRLSARITWRVRRNQQQRYRYAHSSGGNSPAQAAPRAKWAAAVAAWKALPAAEQARWAPRGWGRAISGYNAWMADYMRTPNPPPPTPS